MKILKRCEVEPMIGDTISHVCDTCGEYVDDEGFCDGDGCVGPCAPDPRLDDRTSCAVCGMRYSFGCGHTPGQESAFLDHCDTTEHLLGDCECFVSRAGYAARYTRDEWRERVADAVRLIVERASVLSNPATADADDPWQSLVKALYRR